jgi:catechol 2,3-dioxygenase-like lactoylglutathione lyase family enzyme
MKAVQLFAIVLMGLMPGQNPAPAPAAAPVMTTAGAFFALSVADLEASSQWYSDTLGLRAVMNDAGAHGPAVIVLEGGGLIVELIHHPEAAPLAKVAPNVHDRMLVHGLVKAGVIVDNFDQTMTAFRERHVDIAYGPYPARPNQRANVIVRDNAGNLIQVFGR